MAAKNRISPTEEQDHIAIMDYARLHAVLKLYLIHYPNGGSRHILEAKKLKRMGVKKGVSDFFLAYPRTQSDGTRYSGLWIELKRKSGSHTSISKEQREWLTLMKNVGYCASVAFGYDKAILLLNDYLKGDFTMPLDEALDIIKNRRN